MTDRGLLLGLLLVIAALGRTIGRLGRVGGLLIAMRPNR